MLHVSCLFVFNFVYAKFLMWRQVSSEEEALRVTLKRAALTKHIYTKLSELCERSGIESVDRIRRAALTVVQCPLDADNLPPTQPTAELTSDQTDRMAFFWETVIGHNEHTFAGEKLVELVRA